MVHSQASEFSQVRLLGICGYFEVIHSFRKPKSTWAGSVLEAGARDADISLS